MILQLDVTCPRCGDEPSHVTSSIPTPPITRTARAVIHCPTCAIDFLIVAELATARPEEERPKGERKPCGTEAAYKYHLRRGEPTCVVCKEAHRVYIDSKTPKGARHARRPEPVPATSSH